MLPIVIIGKGVSACHIPPSDEYHVACISEAVRLCDKCQFLAVNDVPAFKALMRQDFAKAEVLILPTYLHDNPQATSVSSCGEVFEEAVVAGCECPPALLYALPTAKESVKDVPSFGTCWSTSESLVAYLSHLGYREFITCGIERDTAEYHPMFAKSLRARKTSRHFYTNFVRTRRRAKRDGGTFTRWEESRFACACSP